jgi:RecA-family ATPase
LPPREAMIGGLLDRRAMSVVYGGSNTGKTFLVLDLSACITLGKEWHGRRVRKGTVVYIAAEGGLGLAERLTAYRQHRGIKVNDVPLYIIPEPIDLCRRYADVPLLLQRIGELPKEPPLELIVIDTLSRAMAGGNENSPDDMGQFVSNCDRLRRTSAHVMVVHHSGKDDARGARGQASVRAPHRRGPHRCLGWQRVVCKPLTAPLRRRPDCECRSQGSRAGKSR